MRFDDTLTTILAQPAPDSGAKAAVWMQLVDVLAQDRGTLNPDLRQAALARAMELKQDVPLKSRTSAARAISFNCRSAALVSLFGQDAPIVAAPVMLSARLSAEEWKSVLPTLPSPSRSLLRQRKDLELDVKRLLAAFGPSDFALPSAEVLEQSETISQIKELVARIEAYRKDRHDGDVDAPFVDTHPDLAAFRFETGVDGLINWVEGAPRGPIIGIELGAMAEIGEHGVDGHAAGAFRRRTPFRNARMRVPGQGGAGGDWLISGLPRFDAETGRFEGYRCTARRPLRGEHPHPRSTGLVSQGLPPDSLRQLIHELRTPLNAIRGFAEMISAQLLGPVSSPYRERAEAIIADARKLLAMFDDLDVAAKIERGAFEGRSVAGVDAAAILRAAVQDVAPIGSEHRRRLDVEAASDLPPVMLDLITVERLFSRLLSACMSASRGDDRISAHLSLDGNAVRFSVSRPKSLMGLSSQQLFDTSRESDEDLHDGAPLGLGFAMRLIDSMATAVHAGFDVQRESFVLRLPIAVANGAAEGSK